MIAHVPTVIVDVLEQCLGFQPIANLRGLQSLPGMRNFRLHHRMSKRPKLKNLSNQRQQNRPEDPSTIVPAGKKFKKIHSQHVSLRWFCPLPFQSIGSTELLTSCHWQCCCLLASPQKPPVLWGPCVHHKKLERKAGRQIRWLCCIWSPLGVSSWSDQT